jgi:hypothetical protein
MQQARTMILAELSIFSYPIAKLASDLGERAAIRFNIRNVALKQSMNYPPIGLLNIEIIWRLRKTLTRSRQCIFKISSLP